MNISPKYDWNSQRRSSSKKNGPTLTWPKYTKPTKKNSHLELADVVGEVSALLFVFLVNSHLLLALLLPHLSSRRVGGGGRG